MEDKKSEPAHKAALISWESMNLTHHRPTLTTWTQKKVYEIQIYQGSTSDYRETEKKNWWVDGLSCKSRNTQASTLHWILRKLKEKEEDRFQKKKKKSLLREAIHAGTEKLFDVFSKTSFEY